MFFRIIIKATLLFLLFNLLLALSYPLDWVGKATLYNTAFPGRVRLPYGEDSAVFYNLSINNITAMMASHTVAAPAPAQEFRVFLLGDSSTWGWFLPAEQNLATQLNNLGGKTADGRPLRFYNLGYPIMSLSKDLLLLDAALDYEPDMVVWLVTLESFPQEKQLVSPLVQNNPHRLAPLIKTYGLGLDEAAEAWIRPNWAERTLWGQRRPLADLLRLQLVGVSWAATGVDQAIPAHIPLRQRDLTADLTWQSHPAPIPLDNNALAWDVLAAGMAHAAPIPILLINEPIYHSDGAHNDVRYNSFYPRWAYDAYLERLQETAEAHNWAYKEWSTLLPPDSFTDTPVHLTASATAVLAEQIMGEITAVACINPSCPAP